MFCIKCGNRIEESENFCTKCGNDLVLQRELSKNKEYSNEHNYYQRPPIVKSTSNNGLVSLVLGIISFMMPILFPISIIGLIFGLIEKEPDSKKTIGIVLNIVSFVFFLFFTSIFFLFVIGMNEIDNEDSNNPYNYYDYEYDYYNQDDEFSNQTVGNDIYGYLKIPNSWYKMFNGKKESTPQYSFSNLYFVFLDIIDEDISLEKAVENIENNILDDATASHSKIKFKKYDAYIITGKYNKNVYFDIYVFQAEDRKIHMIRMEGPEKNHSFFNIPSSYTFKNTNRSSKDSL